MQIRPPFSTMPPLKKKKLPKLYLDEHIILQAQGGYKAGSSSGWKPVDFFLTSRRFIIYQLQKTIFEIFLENIYNLGSEEHYYAMRKRQAISLYYKYPDSLKNRVILFLVNDPQIWKNKLFQATLLKIDNKLIKKIADQLDQSCQAILWYIWEKRHARINELSDIASASNHMEILTNIKDGINRVSQKEIGCPILSFERSKTDQETGEEILFSWWLAGNPENWNFTTDRLMDIFDEGDFFQIIMEVKNIEKADLTISIEDNQLMIESKKIGSRWKEKFNLPAGVLFENHQIYLKNNLLEIKLQKTNQILTSPH